MINRLKLFLTKTSQTVMGNSQSSVTSNNNADPASFEAISCFLICGYIRQIEKILSPKLIPNEIYQIIYRFHSYQRKIFMLEREPKMDGKWKLKYASINPYDHKLYNLHEIDIGYDYDYANVQCNNAGVCNKQNIKLPRNILNETRISESYDKYDMVFQCGGHCRSQFSDQCYGILHRCNDSTITRYKLPPLPSLISGNSLLYDEHYGLISMGGYKGLVNMGHNVGPDDMTDEVYVLNMNDVSGEEWKWEPLPNMQKKRCLASSLMIPLSNGTQKLVRVGGFQEKPEKEYKLDIEMYDFGAQKWTFAAQSERLRGAGVGVCYCDIRDTVYVIPGSWSSEITEFYDIHKNKFYNFVPTNHNHSWRGDVTLWKDEMNDNLLYVASHWKGCMEFIDIRCDWKWTTLYQRGKGTQSLRDVFECHKAWVRLL